MPIRSLLILFFWPALLHADDSKPPAGSFGFDWLKLLSSKCRKLSAKDIERFGHCAPARESHGFGRYAPTHKCSVNARSEWIIYSSKKQCQEEFATMEANAP